MSKFFSTKINWKNVVFGLALAFSIILLLLLIIYYLMIYLPEKEMEKFSEQVQFIEEKMRCESFSRFSFRERSSCCHCKPLSRLSDREKFSCCHCEPSLVVIASPRGAKQSKLDCFGRPPKDGSLAMTKCKQRYEILYNN